MSSSEKDSYLFLLKKIKNIKARICIVGLGYVGLPLAVELSERGYFVYGLDSNPSRIQRLKKLKPYIVDIDPHKIGSLIRKRIFFPTTNEKVIKESEVIIICVPTPLRKVKLPDVSYVIKAGRTISRYLEPPQLIILESTSYPTTTREVLLPLFKKKGFKEEEDFFICFSPERLNPGDKKYSLNKIPKIVGGLSYQSAYLAKSLYSQIIKKVSIVSSAEVAETTKLLENTFRLVNIALINEFAILSHKLKISIWEVIEAAKTKPFGFMPFYPGPGIGGHCIPCDPLYLSWKAKELGFKTKMIDLASYINHYMPVYVVERVEKLLKEKGISLEGARILILGVTYKKDVKDLREAPALDIIEILQKKGAKVSFYDPLIPYLKIKNINLKREKISPYSLKKKDCVVIVTGHSMVDYNFILQHSRCIFDTRNVYKKRNKKVSRL